MDTDDDDWANGNDNVHKKIINGSAAAMNTVRGLCPRWTDYCLQGRAALFCGVQSLVGYL